VARPFHKTEAEASDDDRAWLSALAANALDKVMIYAGGPLGHSVSKESLKNAACELFSRDMSVRDWTDWAGLPPPLGFIGDDMRRRTDFSSLFYEHAGGDVRRKHMKFGLLSKMCEEGDVSKDLEAYGYLR